MKQTITKISRKLQRLMQLLQKNISQKIPVSPVFILLYTVLILSSIHLISLLIELKEKPHPTFDKSNQVFFHSDFDVSEFHKSSEEESDILWDFDFISDTSYQKYVDPDVPFQELWYIPPDMRSLSLTYITDTRGDLRLRETAAMALEELAEDFYNHFWEKVVVVSSYRSYERQRQIKAGWCPDHLCAKAWYSEHQSGLAVDFWSASTEAYWQWSPRLMRFYDWLYDNAHLYGYHNSYQNGVEIDGYAVEPWHWRYLWVELATYLRENEITFAEYYYKLVI